MGFWKGFVIGGLAGSAYGFWTAPGPGADARASMAERAEGALLRIAGIDVWQPEEAIPEVGPYRPMVPDRPAAVEQM